MSPTAPDGDAADLAGAEGGDYAVWLGRSEMAFDRLDPARTNALENSLGRGGGLRQGDALPLLHHWLYFWNVQPPCGLGDDGHPALGGLLPPAPLPRRMWAGGRLRFLKPLCVGDEVTRVSTILSIKTKTGRTGRLVFVTVQHDLTGSDGLAVVEEQDIVYREAETAQAGEPQPTPPSSPPSTWRDLVDPDPVLLFRYSALTMNGHRIHYDRPYAQDVESYPGLLVHGPLQATLLASLGDRHSGRRATAFEFRGQAPAFAGAALAICGEPTAEGAVLWSEQNGRKAMTATLTCADPS